MDVLANYHTNLFFFDLFAAIPNALYREAITQLVCSL
ncbi:hypothetical protein ROSMUCSMR3_02816 [Roseovarius mucosus]|uniref:Uncharacterized protein n=1 Tax=Roseovarius mucosus TaxID=215743 RepID=A0A1V0RR92_9RHOB|nr:hypothetical protein ROSMUCSMR3_02816 [Roseovarius mucosus]